MEQQIVFVTHDGEYQVQDIQPGEDGTELVHVEEAEPGVHIGTADGVQEEEACHQETLKEITAEPMDDLNLECEGRWSTVKYSFGIVVYAENNF